MATLITGLGYIGAALARRLLDLGDEVVAIESYFSTPRAAIEALARGEPLTVVEGSISNPETLARAFGHDEIGVVFHLAGQASAQPGAASIAYTQETNYTGPRLLLDACREAGVRRVVLASSARLYRTPLPTRVSEESPVQPADLIHLSHLYGELLLGAYHEQARVGVTDRLPVQQPSAMVAARIGIVHGVSPVMKTDPTFLAVPQRFCLQAVRGERLLAATGVHSNHAFVHLDDVVQGLLYCCELPPGVRVANVATEVRSVAEVARMVQAAARARGIAVEIEYRGRPSRQAARRITSRLEPYGFQPTRRLEDSLGSVLDYYLSLAGPASAAGRS